MYQTAVLFGFVLEHLRGLLIDIKENDANTQDLPLYTNQTNEVFAANNFCFLCSVFIVTECFIVF